MEIFQGDVIRAAEFAESPHLSPVRCGSCDAYITVEQENFVFRRHRIDDETCYQCGEWLDEETVIADIHPTSEHLMDIHAAKDAVWFHATNRADWIGDLLSDKELDGSFPLVHVGTEEAARCMIADKYARHYADVYLYRVRLAPDAVIDADLYDDENMWPYRTSEIGGDSNAFRYVNRWEATGSISMLVDPRYLVVEEVIHIDGNGNAKRHDIAPIVGIEAYLAA